MPLLWLSLAFLLGLLAGFAWGGTGWLWAGVGLVGLVIAFFEGRWLAHRARYASWRRLARLPAALLLAGFCAGGLRASLSTVQWNPADLAWYNDRGTVRAVGIIARPPEQRQSSVTLLIAVDTLTELAEDQGTAEARAVRGQLLARLPLGGDWQYGDRVVLEGRLTAASEESSASYAEYLANQGIHSVTSYPKITLVAHNTGNLLLAVLYDLRALALKTLRQLWRQPESALMAGILLGYDHDLPPAVTEAFQRTGTAHIIAISGFNISILAGLFVRGFGRFMRRWLAVVLALLSISLYTVLVGAQPAVVRAAIMGTVGLFGPLLGRRQVGVNSLAFVAAGMCLFNPRLPWDVSFQLSFSGTLGLVLFADPLLNGLRLWLARWLPATWSQKLAQPLAEYVLFTLAAQLTTLPIIAYHFQRVSLSAVLANPLVLPIQPLVMVLGGLALIAGLAWLPLGQLLAEILLPLPAYTIRAVEALAQLPNGSLVTGQASLALVIVYYVVLFTIAAGVLTPGKMKSWLAPGTGLVLAALLTAGLWRSALASPDGKLHLTLLGLDGGPALLVRAPDGQTILLNGASDARALEDALARRLPPFGARLDLLLVTTRYTSTLTALTSLVERFPPAQAALGNATGSSSARSRLVSAIKAQDTPVKKLQSGEQVELGNGAKLRVLGENQEGATFIVEWGNFRALLPGGITAPLPARPDRQAIQTPSLLVLTPADLEAQPAEAWARLQPAQVVWYQKGGLLDQPGWLNLEQAGWIEIITDGEKLWMEAGR